MERSCPVCGENIKGRADKIFCSDYCRNSHNNELNRDVKSVMRNTNYQLRKNYRILQKLNVQDKTKTTKNKLSQSGFDFDLITSIYTTKSGTMYYYVYDQGYLPLDNDFYLLVKKGN